MRVDLNSTVFGTLATIIAFAFAFVVVSAGRAESPTEKLFRERVLPIVERNCLGCHNDGDRKGQLSFETGESLSRGGESGAVIVPGKPDGSRLVEMISGTKPEMPKDGKPLAKDEVEAIREWIAAGAEWSKGLRLRDRRVADANWWSLQPLVAPKLPALNAADERWCRTPIDRFIVSKLREKGLSPSAEADRRTLIRRLSFDLIGLPPTADEIEAFVADREDRAYEKLVDRLLASPQYGERWARHWLDVVHYGDTHGFDKDKLRPNAWPYRDYVIRSLNDDKPFARFVEEQLAGDRLFPDTADGIVALGFIAAGPFDYVGHIEVSETKTDGQICRMLDRDDMVRTTMETFCSMTVGCARCHNHKFDPITQEDYYSLQAVFAAVDRADRPFDRTPDVARERRAIEARQRDLAAERAEIDRKLAAAAGPALAEIDKRLATLSSKRADERPEFGYHSAIEQKQDVVKWVQVDLGKPTPIAQIAYVGCHDDFNGIGAGFGFPVRYKIELSGDPDFKRGATTVVDRTQSDVPNPGVAPQKAAAGGKEARYVRFTATRLAPRQNDFIVALAELMVFTPDGKNAALGAAVSSLDSIEAPPRWGRKNLVDGYYFGVGKSKPAEVAKLTDERKSLIEKSLDAATRERMAKLDSEARSLDAKLHALPAPGIVYAAATEFTAEGSHLPSHGKPREVSILRRGDVRSPMTAVGPGAVACVAALPTRFTDAAAGSESDRRAALAHWITSPQNPLTWRSIVNRTWHYHFGRGLVDTPNDFGRMGSKPSHPELVDWLAAWFRDEAGGGQSLKKLHKLIVMSAVYRQESLVDASQNEGPARQAGPTVDADNRYLWRMNRRKLEAEAIRDSVLFVAGKLDRTMGGPGYRAFGFQDDHSPRYLYDQFDPDEPQSHRRSIYRLIVRSAPDPFFESLDCADPSALVERRNETLTALQALAMLNNKFMVRMAEHFAERVEKTVPPGADWPARIDAAFRLAFGRSPTADERAILVEFGSKQGLSAVCRLIFNMNEFAFTD